MQQEYLVIVTFQNSINGSSAFEQYFYGDQAQALRRPNGPFCSLSAPKAVNYLMPEFKKVDYLLKIETSLNELRTKALVLQIKSIKEVVSIYSIPLSKIKNINHLNR